MPPIELLNRLIVPLEKRYDFQMLPNGKKICVPFDQLILFSTNLEPKPLVDEAFLRRIPYKFHAADPTEAIFRRLIAICGLKLGFPQVDPAALDHLIDRNFRATGRPLRSCQPRDLLLQVRTYCTANYLPLVVTPEWFDIAVDNYFAVVWEAGERPFGPPADLRKSDCGRGRIGVAFPHCDGISFRNIVRFGMYCPSSARVGPGLARAARESPQRSHPNATMRICSGRPPDGRLARTEGSRWPHRGCRPRPRSLRSTVHFRAIWRRAPTPDVEERLVPGWHRW